MTPTDILVPFFVVSIMSILGFGVWWAVCFLYPQYDGSDKVTRAILGTILVISLFVFFATLFISIGIKINEADNICSQPAIFQKMGK